MVHYKFFLALVVGLLLAEGGQAQTITFDPLPAAKGITKRGIPQFVGCDGSGIVLVQYGGRRRNHPELVKYDPGMQELASVPIGGDDGLTCQGGFLNARYIDLLQVVVSDTGLYAFRDRHDATTLRPAGDTLVLARFGGQRGDGFAARTAVSADEKLVAGVFVADRGIQGMDVKVGLYDRELMPYWTHNCAWVKFDRVYVTDSGEVVLYTLGDEPGRTGSKGGEMAFTIVDGEQELHVEFALPEGEMIMDKALLRYGDGNILVAAAVRKEHHVVMPIGTNIDAVNIYCYNIATKRLTVEQHPFTQQEVNRLTSEKETHSWRHSWVQFGELQQQIADAQGAYLMIGQQWMVTLNSAPMTQQRRGIMVMRVDRNGKIEWTTTRRFDANTAWQQRSYLDQQWLSTPKGIMLAWVDHIANVGFPTSKPYKVFNPFKSKATLNVWTLGPDGKEDLSFIEVARSAMAGSAHRADANGQYLVLLSTGNRQQFTKITIE